MALTDDQLNRLDDLATGILLEYDVQAPPVPVEKILSHPPHDLPVIDISDLSLVFGVGEHRYEYRMALGRLLYRELHRIGGVDADIAYNSEAANCFAQALLIPAPWATDALAPPGVTLASLTEVFQVPENAVALRLTRLGLPVPGAP